MITAGLITFLLSQSPVTAICSTRIFPATGPVGAIYPQIVMQQISGQEDDTFDGALGMGEDRYQLTCWAETYAASEGLAKAVITALNGTAAAMGSQQAFDCEIVGQHDVLGEAVDLALRKYGKQVDVKIVRTT
ncbi:MAG: tail completion protein gp17 [Phycisphaerae bacterium]